jgi:hypothetical protein
MRISMGAFWPIPSRVSRLHLVLWAKYLAVFKSLCFVFLGPPKRTPNTTSEDVWSRMVWNTTSSRFYLHRWTFWSVRHAVFIQCTRNIRLDLRKGRQKNKTSLKIPKIHNGFLSSIHFPMETSTTYHTQGSNSPSTVRWRMKSYLWPRTRKLSVFFKFSTWMIP